MKPPTPSKLERLKADCRKLIAEIRELEAKLPPPQDARGIVVAGAVEGFLSSQRRFAMCCQLVTSHPANHKPAPLSKLPAEKQPEAWDNIN